MLSARLGSSARASFTVRGVASIPHLSQAVTHVASNSAPSSGGADEEAFGFLDAVLADTPEDAVFLDAFPARLGVFHRVARAAVEQAVEAGACAVDEVALFEQQRLAPRAWRGRARFPRPWLRRR